MPSVELSFQIQVRGQESPEKAIEAAKAVAVDMLERLPGGMDEWKLAECTPEPDDEVRWEVYSMLGDKVLRGGETWKCKLVYLALVPLK